MEHIRLTPRQRKFCEVYLADPEKNGAKAVREANFSGRGGNDRTYAAYLLTLPNIKEYMRLRMKNVYEEEGVSLQWKVRKLKAATEIGIPDLEKLEEEKKEEAVKLMDLGKGIQAISELNKMDGSYAAEKKEVTVDTTSMHEKLKEIEEEFEKEY